MHIMPIRTRLATDNNDRRKIHHCFRTGKTLSTIRKAQWSLTCPNERRSLMTCIISLRMRAYSVEERSSVSQLSSGEDCLPVDRELVAEVVVCRLPSLKFIGTIEGGKRE